MAMKFRAHDTFFIRKGWLSKGMKYVCNKPDIDIKPEYRSRLDNVIKDFYIPVLKEAVLYKRAVGFFSSTAYDYTLSAVYVL